MQSFRHGLGALGIDLQAHFGELAACFRKNFAGTPPVASRTEDLGMHDLCQIQTTLIPHSCEPKLTGGSIGPAIEVPAAGPM